MKRRGLVVAALLLVGCEIGTCPSVSELPVPRPGEARWGLGWGLDGCGSFFVSHCAADVFRRVTDRLGGKDLRIASVRVARRQVLLRAQVPGRPEDFDDYAIDLAGNVSYESQVKRVTGDGLERRLIRASDVPLELVPGLRRSTLAALKLDRARVTSISLVPRPGRPTQFEVDASSPRGDGSAVFDTNGQLLSVSRP